MRRVTRLAQDLLVVDVGNSKVQGTLFAAGRERWRFCVPYDTPGWTRCVAAAASVARQHMSRSVPALLASVAPRRAAAVTSRLRRAGSRARPVSWRHAWPFELAVGSPETVGVDRLANAAGLVALGYTSGIAIDVGTAVTIDVLLRRRFRGGLILPGGVLQARALHAHTALLPALAPRPGVPLLGTDTRAAVEAGIVHGLRHAVAGTTRALQARYPGLQTVVTTGGGAALLAGALAGARHEPGLLALGLRLLASPRTMK